MRTDGGSGVRVDMTCFDKAWAILKPGEPVPDVTDMAMLWKVSPLPMGVTKEVLHMWGNALNWTIKPIKTLRKQQWLIASNELPPKPNLSFNGSLLILQKVDQKPGRETFPLAAGPMPRKDGARKTPSNPDSSASSNKTNAFRTGDPFQDPWAQYRANQLEATSSQHSATTSRSGTTATEGPVQRQLDAQDAKILALERQMQELHVKVTDEATATQRKLEELDEGLQSHASQSQQAFLDFQQSLQQSLTNCMAQKMQETLSVQEDRIAANIAKAMSEMQQMYRNAPKKRTAEASLPDSDDMGLEGEM